MVCVHQSVLINTYLTHYRSVTAQLACEAAGKHTCTTAGTYVNMSLCLHAHTFHHAVNAQIQLDRVISVQPYYNYVKGPCCLETTACKIVKSVSKGHQRVK